MPISRRDFLKLSAAALAGALLPIDGAEAAGQVRGLYFPGHFLADPDATAAFKDLVLRSRANAVVMDVKNEGGIVHLEFEHPLKPSRQPKYAYPYQLLALFEWCRVNGIHPVARQVVFQDPWFARANPNHALVDESGNLWLGADGTGRAFADPFSEAAHDYNAAIAEAAARMGFPEVQFDYVRFPTGSMRGVNFREAWTFEGRTAAIAGFLATAAPRVRAAGALVAADVFGVSAFPEHRDSGIGQHLETMAPHLDVFCPMAYPSTYGSGISPCPDRCIPAPEHPLEIVYHTTRLALSRISGVAPGVRVVPWIQVFDDYRYGLPFGLSEYWAQQRGALAAGATGVYCWRATGDYPEDVFLPAGKSRPSRTNPKRDD